MNILEQYNKKINGEFSFFDRMIIKGHIFGFFSISGKKHFLSYNDILLKDFGKYAQNVTEQICDHIKKYTENKNRPLIYLTSSKTSKEAAALEELKRSPVYEGLICTLSVVEYCSTLQPIMNKEVGKLELKNVNRKCKYYYLYFMDKAFGFILSLEV